MNKSKTTEIVLILSRSGTMQNFRRDAAESFSQLLAGQKAIPGEARLTLVLYDTDYETLFDAMELSQTGPVGAEVFSSEGGCGLLDAVGKTVESVRDRIGAMDEQARPSKVIVAILAGGKDDASRDFTEKHLSRLIRVLQKEHGWRFVYAGSNQDPYAEARAISIRPEGVLHYEMTGAGLKKAYAAINDSITHMRTGKAA
jgi:hypothetical protein